jgi:hypothetical protein
MLYPPYIALYIVRLLVYLTMLLLTFPHNDGRYTGTLTGLTIVLNHANFTRSGFTLSAQHTCISAVLKLQTVRAHHLTHNWSLLP